MIFTDGYHQTEMFPEASTDGAPLFSQPGDDELTPKEKRKIAKMQELLAKVETDREKFRNTPRPNNWALRAAELAAEQTTEIPHFFRAKYPKATPLAIHTERNWTIIAFESADTWVLDAPMPDFWDRGLCYAVFKDGKYVAEKYPEYIAEIGHAMVISSRGETE